MRSAKPGGFTPDADLLHALANKPFQAIYLHLPFCSKICPFCSFPVAKDLRNKKQDYLACLQTEIRLWREFCPQAFTAFQSLYIGGGTPSLYSAKELESLLACLPLPKGVEISIELNPEDASLAYLQDLQALQFNRFSFGIQSSQQKHLSALGRKHTAADNAACFQAIQAAKLENFNLDLLYGYPGYEISDLAADLAVFISHHPTHISAYNLTLEPASALYKKQPVWRNYQKKEQDKIAEQFLYLYQQLEAHQLCCYEISNFAKRGKESRQNQIYWNEKNFLGLGLGAFSRTANAGWHNTFHYQNYQKRLTSDQLPCENFEAVSERARLDEYLLVHLRQPAGLDCRKLEQAFPNIAWPEVLGRFCRLARHQNYFIETADSWRLTPEGMLVADSLSLALSLSVEQEQTNRNSGR